MDELTIADEEAIAKEKAHEAIDLLKAAVLTVVKHETETGDGIGRAEIRDALEIGKEYYPTSKNGWDMGQAVLTILLLLQKDGLIERSSLNDKKWVLS